MFYQNEKNLIVIVRYAPLLLIILLSIFITYFVEQSNRQLLQYELNFTKEFYTKFNNEKLVEEIDKVHEYIKNEEQNSHKKLKKYIKARVYEAHSIATNIYNDNKDTKTDEEILALIKSALGSIIYNNGRGYYFMDDINGVKLLQPLNKKMENINSSQLEDVNGYKFVQTIIQTIKDKTERFDKYYWYKNANDKNAYEKMSFYKYFEPLNLAIGTGEYIVDFKEEVQQKVLNYIQNLNLKKMDEYVFVFDYNGNMLVHKNKKNIGKNFLAIKDINNFEYVKKFIDIAQTKESFVTYYNSTLNKEPYKKTSYVKGYDTWGWVFGIGYSQDQLVSVIENFNEKLTKKTHENFKNILIVSISVTTILLVLSILISRYLETIFAKYKKRIRNEEKEFRHLFEYSNIGLAICDTDGKFININSKFTQMLGYKNKKELLNKSWHSISNDEFIEQENKDFTNLIEEKITTYSLEKSYIKEDGTSVDALITANLFKYDKTKKKILFSIIDVTDIKTKDKLLFQQSKMASMGEMIANIAHQWRQPLSLISTASSGMKMQKEYNALSDESFNKSVDTITNATQYLSQTIEDFKNFFTPTTNKQTVNIKQIIDKTLVLVSAEISKNTIEVITNIKDITTESYENDLVQVLINIINNSKDALSNCKYDDRFIFIDTDISDDKNNLIITIKDNGGGIPKDIINNIFEPYFTTKYKSSGTGIGLYMVIEIIEKHMKGKISVKNQSFKHKKNKYYGAEFTIIIPNN